MPRWPSDWLGLSPEASHTTRVAGSHRTNGFGFSNTVELDAGAKSLFAAASSPLVNANHDNASKPWALRIQRALLPRPLVTARRVDGERSRTACSVGK
ncbi:hypothetical protein BRL93_04230 [Xanthomonas oryzae pv. oryzae]|nr:hypothetical protein BRL93_04230 [Xanthomonas oryzae pv. oryzae]